MVVFKVILLSFSIGMCTGITKITVSYQDSVRVERFHIDGWLESRGTENNKGFRIGEWHYFNEEGRICLIERYKNGKKVKVIDFDPVGCVKLETRP